MIARFWADFYFLKLGSALLLFCFLKLFSLLIFITTVIHNLAHRRVGIRRDLHQIQTEVPCCGKCLMNWNDTDLITVGINDPNLSCAYVLIDIYTAALWFVVLVGAFYSYALTSLTETFIQKGRS